MKMGIGDKGVGDKLSGKWDGRGERDDKDGGGGSGFAGGSSGNK